MSKIIKFIMTMPLIGSFLMYLYVISAIIFLESTNIFLIDPKDLPFSVLYDPILFIIIISYLMNVLGLFVLAINLISQNKIISNRFIFLYLFGMLLTVFNFFIDIWHFDFWFFD